MLHCQFDGETLKYLMHGDELAIKGGRGFVEPSLALYRGKYYLTFTPEESWVTDAEYLVGDKPHPRGADGSTFVARVRWSRPSRE